jgi:hypothetical protein
MCQINYGIFARRDQKIGPEAEVAAGAIAASRHCLCEGETVSLHYDG